MAYPVSWHSTILGHICISKYSYGLSIYKSLLFNLNISHILLWCNYSDLIHRFPVYSILTFFESDLQRKFAFLIFSLLTSGRLCKEILSFSHFLCPLAKRSAKFFSFSHFLCPQVRRSAKIFENFAFFFARIRDVQPRFLRILHFSLPAYETFSQDFFLFHIFFANIRDIQPRF